MPSHIVDSEAIFVTPGDPAPLTLTYSTAAPEGANAGSFSFFVALDASALLGGAPSDIDENPDLSGIQLAEGIITDTFDFGLLGFSASEDTDNIDENSDTDVLINFVYTPIPAEGQPFSWPFQDTGQTEVELATVQLQTAEDLEETTVNFVLNEPSSQNPDPDNPDGPPLNEAFDGEEGDILGSVQVSPQTFDLDVDESGDAGAFTDGLNIFRVLAGLGPETMNVTDTDLGQQEVFNNIDNNLEFLDVDNSGGDVPNAGAFTDGLNIFRVLAGLGPETMNVTDTDLGQQQVFNNIEALVP